MNADERRARASRVREMMQSGEVNEAFDDVKAVFIRQWEATRDPVERDNMWRAVNILNLLRSSLGAMMAGEPDGSISAIRRAN